MIRTGSRGPESLLPGSLQAVQGHDDPEVRFLRRPGLSRFTLGRSGGSPHEHVQIREVVFVFRER